MLAKTEETQLDAPVEMPPAIPAEPGDLRRAVRDWVAANATTFKAVAKMADVAESTFVAWLGDKYGGNNANIEKKVSAWLAKQLNFARQKAVLPARVDFVFTPTARKIMATLEHAQGMPDIALIVGAPGVGKTSAIHQYKSQYPSVWLLTARTTLKSAYAIMEYLRVTLGVQETAPSRVSEAIILRLAGSGGLIVVDEAQHLRTDAFDELRSLHDLAGIGMVFAGNHQVWERINGGGKANLAQLSSRIGVVMKIPKSAAGDADELLDAEGIDDPRLRKSLKVIAMQPGALRHMGQVLKIARYQALGANEPLDHTHVNAAYAQRTGEVLA